MKNKIARILLKLWKLFDNTHKNLIINDKNLNKTKNVFSWKLISWLFKFSFSGAFLVIMIIGLSIKQNVCKFFNIDIAIPFMENSVKNKEIEDKIKDINNFLAHKNADFVITTNEINSIKHVLHEIDEKINKPETIKSFTDNIYDNMPGWKTVCVIAISIFIIALFFSHWKGGSPPGEVSTVKGSGGVIKDITTLKQRLNDAEAAFVKVDVKKKIDMVAINNRLETDKNNLIEVIDGAKNVLESQTKIITAFSLGVGCKMLTGPIINTSRNVDELLNTYKQLLVLSSTEKLTFKDIENIREIIVTSLGTTVSQFDYINETIEASRVSLLNAEENIVTLLNDNVGKVCELMITLQKQDAIRQSKLMLTMAKVLIERLDPTGSCIEQLESITQMNEEDMENSYMAMLKKTIKAEDVLEEEKNE